MENVWTTTTAKLLGKPNFKVHTFVPELSLKDKQQIMIFAFRISVPNEISTVCYY